MTENHPDRLAETRLLNATEDLIDAIREEDLPDDAKALLLHAARQALDAQGTVCRARLLLDEHDEDGDA